MSEIKLNDSGVVFEQESHTYILDGVILNGITGMIGKHLFPDKYSNVPQFVLDRAKKRGTEIHQDFATADLFGADIETNWSDEVESYINLKFEQEIDVINNEYLVTDGMNFATAIDKIVTIGNKIYLVDVKTTYILDLDYLSWQLSIGKFFFKMLNPNLEISGLLAIWVKDGKATLHEVKEKPQEQITELLTCEITGKLFADPNKAISDDLKGYEMIANIETLKNQMNELKAIETSLKEQIRIAFDKHGVDKWETDTFEISKTKGYTR